MRYRGTGCTPFGILAIALRSVLRRPLRSALVALTVGIGIATCSASVAFIEGVNRRFDEDLRRVGLDVINVHSRVDLSLGLPLFPPVPPEAVRRVREVLAGEDAAMALSSIGLAVARPAGAGEQEGYVCTLVATEPSQGEVGLAVRAPGRFFDERDVAQRRAVCVLDAFVAERLFGPQGGLGREVELEAGDGGMRLEVVGVMEEPFALRGRFEAFDSMSVARVARVRRLEFKGIYLPRVLLPQGEATPVDEVAVRVRDPARTSALLRKLEATVGQPGSGAYVWSQREWVEEVLARADQFSMLGNIVWVVVLGVAAVMVMTIALIAVRERYGEIGIRRAEGARRRDVVFQLAAESVLLSLAGGAGGVVLGLSVSEALARDTALWGRLIFWEPYVSWDVMALALGLSVLVGLLATALPAGRAAGLDVVEAIRGA